MLLYAAKGCGSALAEIALDWAGVRYDTEWMTFEQVGARSHDALLAANPLHQVPTLVLDEGTVLTESAAIVLWLDEQYPQAGLLPPRGVQPMRWLGSEPSSAITIVPHGDTVTLSGPSNSPPTG